MTVAQAGDTIRLAPGTYTNSATTQRHGEHDKLISIIGPGATNAVMTGRLSLRHSYYQIEGIHFRENYLEMHAHYGTINSNVITKCLFTLGTQGIYMNRSNTDTYGTNGPNFNVIVQNTFSNLMGDGGVVTMGTGNLVSSNWFVDTGGRDALRVWGYKTVISDNVFERILSGTDIGTTYHSDLVQTFDSATSPLLTSKEIIFERNRIIDCTGQFGNIEARSGSTNICDWIIRNNIWSNSRIQINMAVPGFKFYNNTIYNAQYSSGFRFSNGAHNGRVFNNIFCRVGSGVNGSGFYSSKLENTNFLADYNLITDLNDGPHNAPLEGSHSINGGFKPERIFVNPSNGDFRLREDGPAVRAGANLSATVPEDFIQGARPKTGSFSLGAHESIVPPPLSPKNLTTRSSSN